MIKTLVSIEVDLASSQAIRFACQLGGFLEMEVHPVYVKESPPHDVAMGAGWASRTWERETIEQGKGEIAQVIAAEMDVCPVLAEPRVVCGDRDTELLKIIQGDAYDLFVEGVHFGWNPADIFRRFHGRLYEKLSSPLVWVRSLRTLNKVLVLCTDVDGVHATTSALENIWRHCAVPLELAFPSERRAGEVADGLREAVRQAQEELDRSGCAVSVHDGLPADPDAADPDLLKDYGLVVVAAQKHAKKESALFRWLHMVRTSVMVVPYSSHPAAD